MELSEHVDKGGTPDVPDFASFDHAGEEVVNVGTAAIRVDAAVRVAYVNSNQPMERFFHFHNGIDKGIGK